MMLHIEEEKKMLFFSSLLPSNEAFTFEWLLLFLDLTRRQRRCGSISTAFKRKFEIIFALFLRQLKAISHFILCCKAISYERSTNARSFTRQHVFISLIQLLSYCPKKRQKGNESSKRLFLFHSQHHFSKPFEAINCLGDQLALTHKKLKALLHSKILRL